MWKSPFSLVPSEKNAPIFEIFTVEKLWKAFLKFSTEKSTRFSTVHHRVFHRVFHNYEPLISLIRERISDWAFFFVLILISTLSIDAITVEWSRLKICPMVCRGSEVRCLTI